MEQTATENLATEAPIEALTVCEAFKRLVAQKPDQPALRNRDDSFSLTWGELAERVRVVASGLAGLGVGRGDTVAMLLPNVPECHLIDLAAIHLGASSIELEQAILCHPKVTAVAVHAIASDLSEDDIKACIVPTPGATTTPQELHAFFRDALPYYAIPATWNCARTSQSTR